jgi:hypothetical protein
MDEYIGIIIITVVICYLASEIFGRSKHIGRWWTFSLLLSGLIPGIIAVITSPSAKNSPTQGGKSYVIWGWICLVLGVGNTITLVGSKGQTGQLFFAFFIISYYLFELSKGNVVNNDPKYYFDSFKLSKEISPNQTLSQIERVSKDITKNLEQIKSNLLELKESGVLSGIEYDSKLKKIEEEETNDEILKSDEYLKLKNLYDAGVFDTKEFEEKTAVIKNKLIKILTNSSRSHLNNYNIIGEFKCGLALATDSEVMYGFVDENQKVAVEFKYDFAKDFRDNLAFIRFQNKFGFINTSGQEVIKPEFDWADDFSEELCVVRNDDKKYGFIDTQGKAISGFQFDYAYKFENGEAKVQVEKLWGLINRNGEFIQKPKYKKPTDF